MKSSWLLVTVLLLSVRGFAAGDTLGVYFRYNESVLPADMIQRLDSALLSGPLNRNGKLLILGHTDALGGEGYNLQLSRQRALAVKEFLTGAGFNARDIQLLTGLGERQAGAAENPDSRPQDRRVDVILLPGARVVSRIAQVTKPDTATGRFIPPPPDQPGSRRDSAVLTELRPGESLVLNNVYFYPGHHVVRPESYPALQELFQTMLDNPTLKIRVEGHVCCISATAPDALDEQTLKLELSVNRALAIRSMLIDQGIAADRIAASGFGYRFPIVRNERTEQDANRNRRVEIRILSK